MTMTTVRSMVDVSLLLVAIGCFMSSSTGAETVPFDTIRWTVQNGELTTHAGRECLAGTAQVNDVDFSDGVIEFDFLVTGARSYPGLFFRADESGNYERVYFRPHRAGLYPDAIQYTPSFKGVSGWQLYNGEGFTAHAILPENEWLHARIEISGSQARVFLGDDPVPLLTIPYLQLGEATGSIGLWGPADGSAYFSAFSYRSDSTLAFEPPLPIVTAENMLMNWEVSQTFPAEKANSEKYPRFFTFFLAEWYDVTADATGLVDVARYIERQYPEGDIIMARTVMYSDTSQTVRLNFGYSDEIAVFLNGAKLFNGKSSYRYRDSSFVGVVGLYDAVYLPLEKGLNEIMFLVSEQFGGWGFMAQLDRKLPYPEKNHARLEKVWETDSVFLTPESVVYDARRDMLYVSNFDTQYVKDNTDESTFTGFISKLRLDGTVEELKWIAPLNAPCGMVIYDDKLYTVERKYLTEIDIDKGRIIQRYPLPQSDFLNDLTVDGAGTFYITDTRPSSHQDSRIYRFRDGQVEDWLNTGIIRSNGIYFYNNRLIVGNSGDGLLKAVDPESKAITNLASLGGRIIDGIRVDNDGNYLVSHWEGQAYLITTEGTVVEILDTQQEQRNLADFEFIKESNLLIVPTFLANRVIAYRLIESR